MCTPPPGCCSTVYPPQKSRAQGSLSSSPWWFGCAALGPQNRFESWLSWLRADTTCPQAPLTHLLSGWCLRSCSEMLLSPLVSPDHKTILLYVQTPQSQQLHRALAGGTNTLLNSQAGSPEQGRTGPPGSPWLTVQPAGLLWVLFNSIRASEAPYGSRGCSSAGFGLQHRSYAWQRQQSSSSYPVPEWPGVTNGSDGTRVSQPTPKQGKCIPAPVLSQGLLCPSGMWKGKTCLGFWRALLGLEGQVGMAGGGRMLLLVSESSLGSAWAAFTAAQAPEMERPGEVCPQAEGASSFLLSLPSLPAFLFPSVLRSSFP